MSVYLRGILPGEASMSIPQVEATRKTARVTCHVSPNERLLPQGVTEAEAP